VPNIGEVCRIRIQPCAEAWEELPTNAAAARAATTDVFRSMGAVYEWAAQASIIAIY
jgi:hypothetical protein